MKRFLVFTAMLALFSAPAFAVKNSQVVSIPETMKAGSTALAPGDYNVTWTGSGPEVQVTFTKNRKVAATVPAKLVEQVNKNEGLETGSQGGVEVLQSIRMKNATLVLGGSPSAEKKDGQ